MNLWFLERETSVYNNLRWALFDLVIWEVIINKASESIPEIIHKTRCDMTTRK